MPFFFNFFPPFFSCTFLPQKCDVFDISFDVSVLILYHRLANSAHAYFFYALSLLFQSNFELLCVTLSLFDFLFFVNASLLTRDVNLYAHGRIRRRHGTALLVFKECRHYFRSQRRRKVCRQQRYQTCGPAHATCAFCSNELFLIIS